MIAALPSSLSEFWSVLEQQRTQPFLVTAPEAALSETIQGRFQERARLFGHADVVMGLTQKSAHPCLRIAMKGEENTGLMPERIEDNPDAFEILAMTNIGFDSGYFASGIYQIHPRVLREKENALTKKLTTTSQLFGHLLKYGYVFYGVPLDA